MIIDHELKMSDEQEVTESAASTDIIDMGKAGDSEPELHLVIDCDETATASGAATVAFELQTSATSNFSSYTTLAATGAIGKASLIGGKNVLKTRFAKGLKRYVRVYYTVDTGPLTAGKFSAYLVIDVQTA